MSVPVAWRSFWLVAIVVALGCASTPDPMHYRLAHSESHWDVVAGDRVLDDLRPRYPGFFAVILDPSKLRNPKLLALRDDLEHLPVDRRNFDALNSVAIAYFEINYRAESSRGAGLDYLALSQNGAKLLAVPWRAYGETDDARLRASILDFFEDAASGEKLGSAATAGRVAAIVASLERKEPDPERIARIRAITDLARETAGAEAEAVPF